MRWPPWWPTSCGRTGSCPARSTRGWLRRWPRRSPPPPGRTGWPGPSVRRQPAQLTQRLRWAGGHPRLRLEPDATSAVRDLGADRRQRRGLPALAGGPLAAGRRGIDRAAVPPAGLLPGVGRDPGRADQQPPAGLHVRAGGRRGPVLAGGAGLPEATLAVLDHLDLRPRRLVAPAGQHAVPVGLRQQRRGPLRPAPVPALLPRRRRALDLRLRAHRAELTAATGRRVRRDLRRARRLPAALPAGEGAEPGELLLLPPAAAAGLARARVLLRAPGVLRGRCRAGRRWHGGLP